MGPIIELHPCGSSIDARLVQGCSTRRNEVLCAGVAEIVFRGLQVGPIRLGFDTTGVDRSQLITDAAEPGLGQQLLDNSFRLFVSALTELMVSNPPLRIDDVERRPVMVVEGAPDRIVVVDRDGKIDLPVLHSPADVVDVFLESELRRVNADDHESVFLVFPRPRANIGECPEPVDAGVRPEVDQHDLPAQAILRQWLRVEASARPGAIRQLAFNGERSQGRGEQRGEQGHVLYPSTSTTALAKASGASGGTLWPMPL